MSKYSKIVPKDLEKLQEYLGNLYSYVKDDEDVLDFGCSTGYFGELLIRNKKCRVDGIEIDPGDLEKARKVLSKVYSFDLDGDWPEEIFKKKYDTLLFGDIIEHLKFPEETIRKSKKLLKKGGKILISTPNIAHISTRLELLSGDFNYESTGILDNTHLRLFTIETLRKLAADTGFKIIDIDYSLVDFSPSAINRSLDKIGLKASPKFFDFINRPEARAYQYKLVLKPLENGEKSVSVKAPFKPIHEHDIIGEENLKLRKQNNQLLLTVDALNSELNSKNLELSALLNSKTWRLMTTAKKPYSKLVDISKHKDKGTN